MEEQFLQQLNTSGPATRGILIAVSGGIDSIVLLHLLSKTSLSIGIAHANFQLRGTESDDDERLVRQLAENYVKPVFVKRFCTNNYAIEHGVSIQMAARDLRYAWFSELLQSESYDVIATAHHLNDDLETTLINFVRGTGLTGLGGIQGRGEKLIRPLLTFTRDDIQQYALSNRLVWREDSSNASDDYQRNYVRHQIIPRMKEMNPSLEVGYLRTVGRLAAARELAGMGMTVLRERFVKQTSTGITIDKQLIASTIHAAGILWEFLKEYGFNFPQCEDIVAASSGQPGKLFYGKNCCLTVDRNNLILENTSESFTVVSVTQDQQIASFGGLTVEVKKIPAKAFAVDSVTAAFDSEKLVFPLVWRIWKPGDFFYPLGMEHRKKVSDFLIDRKISASEKQRVSVLESNGSIVWVVGHRIDERYKITSDTTTVHAFSLV